jgi:ketosteroid isomerase-like protein
MRVYVFVMLIVVMLAGCASDRVSYREAIIGANEAMEAHIRAGDLRGVAAMYTDDAVMQGPSDTRVEGREQVEEYWARYTQAVDWELRVDDLSICADRAWQLGQSALTFRDAQGQERVGRVDFYLVWLKQKDGSWLIGQDTWWDPEADYTSAIRRVLEADSALGAVRNEGVRVCAAHEVVGEYARVLGELDFSGCPGDFREAYWQHTRAWERMVGVLEPYADERGEMHDVFDRLTAEGAGSRGRVQDGLDEVWTTWANVEDSVVRHGAQPEGETR